MKYRKLQWKSLAQHSHPLEAVNGWVQAAFIHCILSLLNTAKHCVFVFYMLYDFTVIASLWGNFYILFLRKLRQRKVDKVAQSCKWKWDSDTHLIAKPLILTTTILKNRSHHWEYRALPKGKHYTRRMVCLESRKEKHEHFTVVPTLSREGEHSHQLTWGSRVA